MPACNPAATSRREPEDWNSRYPPLPTVTVPAQDQIDGMVRLNLIEDIRCMGQQ